MATVTTAIERTCEVAHRLIRTPGKCNNIHGHSMRFKVGFRGTVDATSKLNGKDLSELKHIVDKVLEEKFDHHLLLNQDDQWAMPQGIKDTHQDWLPGYIEWNGDPTIESIAEWTFHIFSGIFLDEVDYVEVHETSTNMARCER